MNLKPHLYTFFVLVLLAMTMISSCTHDPLFMGDEMEVTPIDTTMNCDVINVSFMNELVPILDAHCTACHNALDQAGGINLEGHASVQVAALNGRLVGSIKHESGFARMPQDQPKLDDCVIDKFRAWVEDGAPNN